MAIILPGNTGFIHIPAIGSVQTMFSVKEIGQTEIDLHVINGGYVMRLSFEEHTSSDYNEAIETFREKRYYHVIDPYKRSRRSST